MTTAREFLPAALEIIETPASPAGRAIGLVIILAAFSAITWSCLSQIDILTSAPGRIVPAGRSKIIQPFQPGIVQAILVNDGDSVRAGQVLLTLDPTAAAADATRISQDLVAAELDRARLEGLEAALGSGAAPQLRDVPDGATPIAIAAAGAQMRAQALEEAGKLADIDHQIAEKQSEAAQAAAGIAKIEVDKPFLEQIASMRTTLLQEAVGSRLDWLDAEQLLAEAGPDIDIAQAQQAAALASVAALAQARAETQAEYATQIFSDLAQAEQKIGEARQDLVKAEQLVALTTLRAPIAGTVQQLAVHTIGGVVSPGQALLTIVPSGQQLMVEASIKNQDIGFVHVGQTAQVKIGAFDYTRFGAIAGTVVSISHDVVDMTPDAPPANDGYAPPEQVNNAAPQEPEYVAHIALSSSTIMTDAGPAELQAGMGVTADILTGRRRVIGFLLSPFEHEIDEAGHER